MPIEYVLSVNGGRDVEGRRTLMSPLYAFVEDISGRCKNHYGIDPWPIVHEVFFSSDDRGSYHEILISGCGVYASSLRGGTLLAGRDIACGEGHCLRGGT